MITLTITIDAAPPGVLGAHVHVSGHGVPEDPFQALYYESLKRGLPIIFDGVAEAMKAAGLPASTSTTFGTEVRAQQREVIRARGELEDPSAN